MAPKTCEKKAIPPGMAFYMAPVYNPDFRLFDEQHFSFGPEITGGYLIQISA